VAFALHHRMHADAAASGCTGGSPHRVVVVTRGQILSSHPARARALMLALAQERGIGIKEQSAVVSAGDRMLKLESGEELPFDECLWCTQAAPATWLADCDLPKGTRLLVIFAHARGRDETRQLFAHVRSLCLL
jgi:selenide, water dikinase